MEGPKRGIKRKRYDPQQEHHSLKEVRKAAKKAKVFETQKLVKKLKIMRKSFNNSGDITEAEAQLIFLKTMDHEIVADTALKTKLNKDRALSENEHIHAAILNELAPGLLIPEAAGTPGSKVQSRLLSSKILAVEIAAVVEDLKNVLQSKTNSTAEVLEGSDSGHPDLQEKGSKANAKKTDVTPLKPGEGQEDGIDLMEYNGGDEAGWESGTIEGSDEEQGGWESGSSSGGDDGSDDENDRGPGITSDGPSKKTVVPTKVTSTRLPPKSPGIHSTFLPSLSVGFIRGGSDASELSEDEVRAADIDIKKNRRGQRARRAIWEKKYGRNANHKKKESEFKQPPVGRGTVKHSLDYSREGHESRRGPPERRQKEIKPVPQHRQEADSGWGQRVGGVQAGHMMFSQTLARREEKPIHPSWEAKRKLKEKESASILPSQGKKIKFS
ncbi:Bud-site selection protein [Collybia nuda]|uniref:Bud-site selection protein n=1 Tax=Collybia nuda TaxID=64659 RepID=A0A9P5YH47_9AGAR|nr:Bud-site selection protein [Collybia nuda]